MKQEYRLKIIKLIKLSLKDLFIILPIFFIAVLIGVIAETYVPAKVIQSLLGKNLISSILIATIAGMILPFPQYSAYPFAAFLYKSGAYIGAVFGFIAGEIFIGNLFEDYA